MKTKNRVLLVAGWIALGVFNYGTINAEWAWQQRHEYETLHETQRDNLGFMLGESVVVPPLELITSAFLSNFWQHGWDVTSRPWVDPKRPTSKDGDQP